MAECTIDESGRPADLPDALQQVHALMDLYRVRCLWFVRPDYYPSTPDEAMKMLDAIERHGDAAAFRRAATLRQWLSQNPSARSAG